MNKFYITTPLYYVNDVPHIGHAYSTIAADVLARYWREKSDSKNVFFLTGTDEHGAKVAQAAEEAGQTPKDFADSVSPRFAEAWKLLNVGYDYFFRTTNPQHEKLAQEILQKIYDNGHIYKDIYEGLYCEGCEKFLTESDLADGKCPLHPNEEPVRQKEENYFFKLSSFEKQLTGIIKNAEYKILPLSRKNEVLGKLKLGLRDTSVSRAGVSWGIPIPWDKKQTIYVWVEALLNYYTATQFVENKKSFWPADLHIVGKDILWFHVVIWPALLLAAGLPLPKTVFAHGFFTIDGQKISKSLGNVISPQELVEKYGSDASRYLLLSEFPFGEDGDFSFDKLTQRYNADLANGLGNLVSRVAKLAEDNKIKFDPRAIKSTSAAGRSLDSDKAIEEFRFHDALFCATESIAHINSLIDKEKPWEQKGKELKIILIRLIGEILDLDLILRPFIPETMDKITKQFFSSPIKAGEPLFPRIT